MGDSFYQKKTPQKIEMSKNNISTQNEPGPQHSQYVRWHFYFLIKKKEHKINLSVPEENQ